MREIPILFQGAMVRAILDGSKTQTRRMCKPAQAHCLSSVVEVPDPKERGQVYNGSHFGDEDGEVQFASPYGGRGGRLWVREAWRAMAEHNGSRPLDIPWRSPIVYEASRHPDTSFGKLRPGMFMPRWASRITLEVTGVRVERLQDISEADAIAEGIEPDVQPDDLVPLWRNYSTGNTTISPVYSYQTLWESINGPGSWDANPWVWVVEFRRPK